MFKLVKGKQEFRLSGVNLDISKEINLAAQMVKKDITDGIRKRKSDINNRAYKITSNPTPLYDTGQMSNLEPISGKNKATPTRQVAIVAVARTKKYKGTKLTSLEVGLKHMKGDGVPRREWFGIRKKMEDKINKMVRKRIWQKILTSK